MTEVNVGDKFYKLTVVSRVGKFKQWNCVCECGNEKVYPQSDLLSGHDKSCGCNYEKHGMRQHIAYKSWLHMKQRCTNPNNPDFYNYGARGITVHQDFMESFSSWLNEIGERPEGKRWSIGRINNHLGYTYGNMRWETDEQQARNHTKTVSNTSGIVGVMRRSKFVAGKDYPCWVAQWAYEANKKKTKDFSINKYGEEVAKQMAIDHRNAMMEELNKRGFDYAETHGQDKVFIDDEG